MSSDQGVVVLFSGGTDSTLAAALAAEKFSQLHLVTYGRFGFALLDNSRVNAKMIADKYPKVSVSHELINIDKVFKYVSYESYLKNLIKFGFLNLSTCGLCKLSMHVRTIKYCLDHNISYVWDGANAAMSIFPAQMKPVLDLIKEMYEEFGITYENPVFDFDSPGEGSMVDSSHLDLLKDKSPFLKIAPVFDKRPESERGAPMGVTSGDLLFQKGLAPQENVKGSDYDKKRQARCFQLILFNIFAINYSMATKSYHQYRDDTVSFFKHKIGVCTDLLRNRDKKKFKRLML